MQTTQVYVNSHVETATGLAQRLSMNGFVIRSWMVPGPAGAHTWQLLVFRTKPSFHEVRECISWQIGKGAPFYMSHDRCAASAAQHGEMENTEWEVIRGGDSSPTPPWVLPPYLPPSPTHLWAHHGHKRKWLGKLLLGKGLRREATWSNITNPLLPNLLLIIKLFIVNHSLQNSAKSGSSNMFSVN